MKNIEQFEKDLKRDEGEEFKVYEDSRRLLTVGVGHLVLPEDNLKLGQIITPEQCKALLEKDMTIAIHGCEQLCPDFDDMGEELQLIVANMMFNLGLKGLSGFKKFLAAVKDRDYQRAADEMVDSQWYQQVGNRSKELVRRMRALA